jgi:hypothetical protein
MSYHDTLATAGISSAGTLPVTRTALAESGDLTNVVRMLSGLTPTTNFVLRIALALGAGLMMAALL